MLEYKQFQNCTFLKNNSITFQIFKLVSYTDRLLFENGIIKSRAADYPAGIQDRHHLMRYWRSTTGIANSIKVLLQKAQVQNQDVFNLDLNRWEYWFVNCINAYLIYVFLCSPAFAKASLDQYQLEAAKLMLAKPVSVISGRAGTGKTEVATTVWRAMAEKLHGYEIWKSPFLDK